jgi:hypothetical protein
MAMVAAAIERACQQAGELHDIITGISGTPTPAQMDEIKERVKEIEQLTDVASAGVRYAKAVLWGGPEAQQAKRRRSGWQDAQELVAVQRRIQARRVKRRM